MGNSCVDIKDLERISSTALNEFSEKSDLLTQNTDQIFRSLYNNSNHFQTMPL